MRTINFNVNDTIIRKNSLSDFSNLSKEPSVQVIFSFSEEWDSYVKVAEFKRDGKELEPQVLLHGTTCEIPSEALKGNFLQISILGKRGEDRRKTRRLLVNTNEKLRR